MGGAIAGGNSHIKELHELGCIAFKGFTLDAGPQFKWLDHQQQKAFYNCFAGKVNAAYSTMSQFFNAILADTTDMSQIRQMEAGCANDLFDWVITEVEVTETAD